MKRIRFVLTVAALLAAAAIPNGAQAAATADVQPSATAGLYAGWVVGHSDSGYGAIFHSGDGGATWTRQGSPATVPDTMLQAVAAIDPLTCWVVGESADGYGTILRTEDGGATWTRQGSPATIPDCGLAKISVVDRYTAWVVGTPGIILFTEDGGRTWAQRQTADIPPVLLQGVYALDRDNVWVTGDQHEGYGTIFRTGDGGGTWQRKGSSEDVSHSALLDVHAVDEDTAWIACQGGAVSPTTSLMKTDDNGATWTGQVLGSGFFDTNSVTAIGESVVWATTDADGIYRSENARDFVQQEAAQGKYDYYLTSICALDADTAWVAGPAGGGTGAGIVQHTSDGGQTWINQFEVDIALQAVSFTRASTCYFAEGTTRPGFEPYLCVANPGGTAAEVAVTYILGDGTTREQALSVPPTSRATIAVSSVLGSADSADHDFSAVVVCTNNQVVAAERPMYFSYGTGGWTGGSCVAGAPAPANEWYFAEGYTGPGFEEWICVLNPGPEAAGLTFRFHTSEEGEKVVTGRTMPPRSRGTFLVNDLLGTGYECSLALESTQPVVAERPMYFDYRDMWGHSWSGGHCVMGATALSTGYYFAEGYTGAGFEEWLCIQNPGTEPVEVAATFMLETGETVEKEYTVDAASRRTLYVPHELMQMDREVSARLTSAARFLAERPMYFDYSGRGAGGWTGGHCAIGSTAPAGEWFFAEGYTGGGFQQWLTLQNPGGTDAVVETTYYTREEGALPAREVVVPAHARQTVYVNEDAGPGFQLSCRLRVTSGPAVVAERPMYFSYGPGWTGGHVTAGAR